jgi:hypothetical protein
MLHNRENAKVKIVPANSVSLVMFQTLSVNNQQEPTLRILPKLKSSPKALSRLRLVVRNIVTGKDPRGAPKGQL